MTHIFSPYAVPLDSPAERKPLIKVASDLGMDRINPLELGKEHFNGVVKSRIGKRTISLNWEEKGKDLQSPTAVTHKLQFYYVDASSLSETTKLEDKNSRPHRTLTQLIDPIFKEAFSRGFLEVVSLSLREGRLRFEPNEMAKNDYEVSFLRLHHWTMEPDDEKSDTEVQSHLIQLEKVYAFVQGQTVVIVDLSKEQAVGNKLVEMIGGHVAGAAPEFSSDTFETPLKLLRTIYGMVMQNHDVTVDKISEQIAGLNGTGKLEQLPVEALKHLEGIFSTHQTSLGIAVSKLIEHLPTAQGTLDDFVAILSKGSPDPWALTAMKNMKNFSGLVQSRVAETERDLGTLAKRSESVTRFRIEAEKLGAQRDKLEQAQRFDAVNQEYARSNMSMQKAILFFGVVGVTQTSISSSNLLISKAYQSTGTNVAIGTISFLMSASLALYFLRKESRAVKNRARSIAKISSVVPIEYGSQDAEE